MIFTHKWLKNIKNKFKQETFFFENRSDLGMVMSDTHMVVL